MDSPYMSDDDNQSIENTVHLPNHVHHDLSGVNICGLCARLIEDEQPKTELLCHHVFHSVCFLYFLDDFNRCSVCNAQFLQAENIPTEIRGLVMDRIEARRKNKKQKMLEKVMENKELLADLKLVKRNILHLKKASTSFRKLGRRLKQEFSEETNNMKEMLLAIKKRKKQSLMKSAELKDWKSKRQRLQYYMRVFDLKYRDTPLDTLRMIPSLKLPSRWYMRDILYISPWTIDRWLRIRI